MITTAEREIKLREFLTDTLQNSYLAFEVQVNNEEEGITDFTVRITANKIKYHDYGEFVMRVEDGYDDVQKLINEDFEAVDGQEFLRHMFLQQFLIGPEEAADLEREKQTGAYLIAKERKSHKRGVLFDVEVNADYQLVRATNALITHPNTDAKMIYRIMPSDWHNPTCRKLAALPYEQRLIKAGGLIAAEYDRVIETAKQHGRG